jgi:hypothetical protein
MAVSKQRAGQLLKLRALAAAIESFKSYEFSASRHLRDDSRRFDLRTATPQPRATRFSFVNLPALGD